MDHQNNIIKLVRMPFLEEENPDPDVWTAGRINEYIEGIVAKYNYPPVAALMLPAIVGVCRELVLVKVDEELSRAQRVSLISSLLGKLSVLCSKAAMARENIARPASKKDGLVRGHDIADGPDKFMAQSEITDAA